MAYNVIKTNFTAGELSPKLMGRVDVDRYINGAKELTNIECQIWGGVTKRKGCELDYTEGLLIDSLPYTVRSIPYVFNNRQAYVIQFKYILNAPLYRQVWFQVFDSEGNRIAIDSAIYGLTPEEADTMTYTQALDTLIFVTGLRFMQLRRIIATNGSISWRMTELKIQNQPMNSDWIGVGSIDYSSTEQFSTTVQTGSNLVTIHSRYGNETSGNGKFFKPSDVGNDFEWFGLNFTVQSVTDISATETTVIGDINSGDYLGQAGVWTPAQSLSSQVKIFFAPMVALKCMTEGEISVGQIVTFMQDGTPTLRNAFRQSIVDGYITWNGGVFEIIGFGDDYFSFPAKCIVPPTANIVSPAGAWNLKYSDWLYDHDGFPTKIEYFQQRLWVAKYNKIWASVLGNPFDFFNGVEDDEGFQITIASENADKITGMIDQRYLLVFTEGREYTITGDGSAITPTNVSVKAQTNYGAADSDPIIVANEAWFIQSARRKIRAAAAKYDDYDSVYDSPDQTILSEHITLSGAKRIVYAQEPNPMVYALLYDGTLACATVEKEQAVIAWSKIKSDFFEFMDICVVPVEGEDRLFAVVKHRAIRQGGDISLNTMTYVHFTQDNYMDCRASITIPSTGAESFELPMDFPLKKGETEHEVQVFGRLAQGEEMQYLGTFTPTYIVDSQDLTHATITLPATVYAVEIGIGYTSRIVTLPTEITSSSGSILTASSTNTKITLYVYETKSAKINGKLIPFKQYGVSDFLTDDEKVTGLVQIGGIGWQIGQPLVTIESDLPYPLYIEYIVTASQFNNVT